MPDLQVKPPGRQTGTALAFHHAPVLGFRSCLPTVSRTNRREVKVAGSGAVVLSTESC